jgi:hypothetical protein
VGAVPSGRELTILERLGVQPWLQRAASRASVPCMRIVPGYGVMLSLTLAACGGGQVAPVASAAEAPSLGAQAGVSSSASAKLDDGGAAPDVASAGGSAVAEAEVDAGRVGRHAHEPGRGREDIRALVVAHRDEARACYEKALQAHPGLEGNLVIQWTIDPKGTVTQIASDPARSQILEPTLASCIGDVLTRIQFAPSQRGFETKAFYPFNFHPRHTATTMPPTRAP